MFRRFSFLVASLGFMAGGVVASAQSGLPVGAPRAEVVERLGQPSGSAQVGVREVLYYPQGSVVLVDGKVERSTFSARPSPVVSPPPVATRAAAPSPWPAPPGWPGSASRDAVGGGAAAPSSTVPVASGVAAAETAADAVTPVVTPSVAPTSGPVTARPGSASRPGVGEARPTPAIMEWWWPTLVTLGGLFVVLAGGAVWLRWWLRGRKRRRTLTDALLAVEPPRDGRRMAAEAPAGVMVPVWPEVDTSVWSMALLRALEWHRFEAVVAEYFRRLGYRAELTGFGPDGGVDVVVSRLTESSPCVLVQCKAWDAEVIGVRLVRELYGVAAARGIKACAFFTTSTFHAEALAFAGPVAMDCSDGADFLQRILALPTEDQAALLALATAEDFRTPTCCACGIKMVPRQGSKSGAFFGCRNYPRCHQTLTPGAVRWEVVGG